MHKPWQLRVEVRSHIAVIFASFLPFLTASTAGCGGGEKGSLATTRQVRRVACVGDSITYGAGIADYRRNAYPSQLSRMLGAGRAAGNFGWPGATLLQQGDQPFVATKAFQEVSSYKPDTIIIQLGTNDSKAQNWQYRAAFLRDATDLVARFRQLPSVRRIFLCVPPPIFSDGAFGIQRDVLRQEVAADIMQAAQENNVPLIDLYTPLEDKPESLPDGVHPNTTGAHLIAQTVYAVLEAVDPLPR